MSHKTLYLTIILAALILIVPTFIKAQNLRTDKLYSSSGVGFSFPVGETNEYLKPKFSTTLGINLGLGNNGLFLYPKVSLHAYKYQQQTLDAGFTTLVNNGRVTTYLLNMALGYRKIIVDFGFYGFVGGGGGFLLTPEVTLSKSNTVASFNNKTNGMTMLETGMGMEYSLGKVSVFLEGTYMRGFNKIQERSFQTIPLSIGIKPNLSSLLNGKK